MLSPRDPAKIWNPTYIPQQVNRGPITGARLHFAIFNQHFKSTQVVTLAHAGQPIIVCMNFQRRNKRLSGTKLEF